MAMICDSCHQECYGISIRGLMQHDRVLGRKAAHTCHKCEDKILYKTPCGSDIKYMMFGRITCGHGFVYKLDYRWENGSVVLFYKMVDKNWKSYFPWNKRNHPIEYNE